MPQKTSGSPKWDAALLARINLDFVEGKQFCIFLLFFYFFLKSTIN
jgi:hypothetical protein